MKILQLNSSIRGQDSISTKYANAVSEKLQKNNQAQVIIRDIASNPVSQLDNQALSALFSGNLEHSIVSEHTQLIDELKSVDTLVIAAPMYNFSVPATLKNYFDAIARAGSTFKYSETGPIGLLNINKAYVVLSRGGVYQNKVSFQEDFIETMLKFVGVKEVEFIYVEGLNLGAQSLENAEKYAVEQIANI
jgi:FMN-dependent NADH-azoreductase